MTRMTSRRVDVREVIYFPVFFLAKSMCIIVDRVDMLRDSIKR